VQQLAPEQVSLSRYSVNQRTAGLLSGVALTDRGGKYALNCSQIGDARTHV
jgi:hypothetical protein